MKLLENVILDCDSFKALSSHVRIDMLKRLDGRGLTVTDLSKALKISKSAAFKHLAKLVEAGLIERQDDPRKWVYYKITNKGIKILHPERAKVSILLSWALMLFGVGLVAMALYLVWFQMPVLRLDPSALSVCAVVGVMLLVSGGTLVLKNPGRSRFIQEDLPRVRTS